MWARSAFAWYSAGVRPASPCGHPQVKPRPCRKHLRPGSRSTAESPRRSRRLRCALLRPPRRRLPQHRAQGALRRWRLPRNPTRERVMVVPTSSSPKHAERSKLRACSANAPTRAARSIRWNERCPKFANSRRVPTSSARAPPPRSRWGRRANGFAAPAANARANRDEVCARLACVAFALCR